MQFQRVSPNAVRVFAPVEAVREAAWHALVNERIRTPVIDAEKNVVSAMQGDGILTVARVITARFTPEPEGTLVTFKSKALLGAIDFGAGGRAKKLANSFERVLASGYSPTPVVEQRQISQSSAPIADPLSTGHVAPNMAGQPIYGLVLAPKRGVTLLVYGLLSMVCCPIMIPFTLIYGIIALSEYKKLGDPGDKTLVIAGMAASVLAVFTTAAAFGLGF